MTTSPNPEANSPEPRPSRVRRAMPLVRSALVPLILAIAATATCEVAAGASLGVYFGGLFVLTLLVPPLVLGQPRIGWRIVSAAAVTVGVSAVWAVTAARSATSAGEWVAAAGVATAYTTALLGIASILSKPRLPIVLASAVTVMAGFAWMTWPIWLSPELRAQSQTRVQWLVRLYPPLVLNGVLKQTAPWTEQTLAYHLTNLNQDVPFQLPDSAAACIAVHSAVGLALIGASCAPIRRRARLDRRPVAQQIG